MISADDDGDGFGSLETGSWGSGGWGSGDCPGDGDGGCGSGIDDGDGASDGDGAGDGGEWILGDGCGYDEFATALPLPAVTVY